MTKKLDQLIENSAIYGSNAAFIEGLYEQYLKEPSTIDGKWRDYFDRIQEDGDVHQLDTAHSAVIESFARLAGQHGHASTANCLPPLAAEKQAAVLRLINSYRLRGQQHAKLDPLELCERPPVPDLAPEFHGLGELDMDVLFNTGSLFAPERLALRDILALVDASYCGSVGTEYAHITDTQNKRWIQKRLEESRAEPNLSDAEKRHTLEKLVAAEGIEKYLHTRYVGQKRFSLEGGESLIVLLDELIQQAGAQGTKEVVLGMAHRGRLNVLINTLGKPPELLFQEFEGKNPQKHSGSGDVKYHQGFSCDVDTPGGPLHLALAFNPSHLEIINPVIEGSVRARQQQRGDKAGREVLPILIHGDAAFAGQGVVMETLNMSQTRGFSTGGTVHIVINNRIGFTTSNPMDARSTMYCTDIAKMVQAPIFHVNGDDPEAVVFVTRLALDYCVEYATDVVIDMVCYRRHGHNEADEPAATQPQMYHKIRQTPTTLALYTQKLVDEQVVTVEQAADMVARYRERVEHGKSVARPLARYQAPYTADWTPFFKRQWHEAYDSCVPLQKIRTLSERLLQIPANFSLHPRVQKIMDSRRKMAAGAMPIDWGFAETMAYATLLEEGYPVRLSGQDSGRGTFFHRHAVLHNQQDGERYVPLQHCDEAQGNFLVIDSFLSEEAVLGFEFGYATKSPNSLVIWEGQFGDFANGAQVVIDQFICSGESKWGRLCGLTMLLPHGYEGQGPEHSSARLERYLQLCAEKNIQVCVPSSPAQVFHMLRRQMVRTYRKPLIVMSPKSLLRNPMAVSTLETLSEGQFYPVLDEVDELIPAEVKTLVLCSGKIFYEVLSVRREHAIKNIALIRLEQLYPFPTQDLDRIIARYPNAEKLVWCQEEPKNQGAWDQIKFRFKPYIAQYTLALHYAGRPTAASPATGSHHRHVAQQTQVIRQALQLDQKEEEGYPA